MAEIEQHVLLSHSETSRTSYNYNKTEGMVIESPQLLLSRAIESRYKEEYSALIENRRDIDRKSQGIIALAGLLLAGIFAITSREGFSAGAGTIVFLATTITSLAIALLCAILALRNRKVRTPPLASQLKQIYSDVERGNGDDEPSVFVANFVRDQFDSWEDAVNDLRKTNEVKASNLFQGHFFAVVALISVFVTILLVVTNNIK